MWLIGHHNYGENNIWAVSSNCPTGLWWPIWFGTAHTTIVPYTNRIKSVDGIEQTSEHDSFRRWVVHCVSGRNRKNGWSQKTTLDRRDGVSSRNRVHQEVRSCQEKSIYAQLLFDKNLIGCPQYQSNNRVGAEKRQRPESYRFYQERRSVGCLRGIRSGLQKVQFLAPLTTIFELIGAKYCTYCTPTIGAKYCTPKEIINTTPIKIRNTYFACAILKYVNTYTDTSSFFIKKTGKVINKVNSYFQLCVSNINYIPRSFNYINRDNNLNILRQSKTVYILRGS